MPATGKSSLRSICHASFFSFYLSVSGWQLGDSSILSLILALQRAGSILWTLRKTPVIRGNNCPKCTCVRGVSSLKSHHCGKITFRFKREITHSYWRSWSGASRESIAVWPLKLLPPGQSEAGYVPHYWLWHFCPKNRTLQSLSGSDRHPLWVYDIHTSLDFYRVLVAGYPDGINAKGLLTGTTRLKKKERTSLCFCLL